MATRKGPPLFTCAIQSTPPLGQLSHWPVDAGFSRMRGIHLVFIESMGAANNPHPSSDVAGFSTVGDFRPPPHPRGLPWQLAEPESVKLLSPSLMNCHA